jgi:hypothetical protein
VVVVMVRGEGGGGWRVVLIWMELSHNFTKSGCILRVWCAALLATFTFKGAYFIHDVIGVFGASGAQRVNARLEFRAAHCAQYYIDPLF